MWHKLYRLFKDYTFNPTFPESEVKVISDFSALYGQYKNLSELPVGSEHKKEVEKNGFIVEVKLDKSSKLVILFNDKSEFTESFLNLTEKEDMGYPPSYQVNCAVCGKDQRSLGLFGDIIQETFPYIGQTNSKSELSGLCFDCSREIMSEVITDPSFKEVSEEDIVSRSI